MTAQIRKIAINVEETHKEIGRPILPATRKAVAVAVITNPFAGKYVEDLGDLMEIGAELGTLLGRKCVEALGIPAGEAESYGKSVRLAKMVSWNTPRQFCIQSWVLLYEKKSKRGPLLCHLPKLWVGRGMCFLYLWGTWTLLMCAVILMGLKYA